MEVTIFPDKFATEQTKVEVEWDDFADRIVSAEEKPSKDACPFIKLATFGEERSPRNCLRTNANVTALSGIEGDYDKGWMPVETAAAILEDAGIKAAIYTSASHTPAKPRWRVVVPFSKPFTGTMREMEAYREGMLRYVDEKLGNILSLESFVLSQSYYIGHVEKTVYSTALVDGDYIDQTYTPKINGTEHDPITKDPGLQGEKFDLNQALHDVLTTANYHEPLNRLAASYISKGMREQDVVDLLQQLMLTNDDSGERWQARFDDIPRAVASAVEKFKPEAPAPKEYSVIWAGETQPRLDEPSIVRGVVKPESMIVTYGESNSGKTFHVIDRDLCMSIGRNWYDRETEPGFVLYVAAEGPHSVERRVSLYLKEYLQDQGFVPLAILPTPVDLLNPAADALPLCDYIKKLEDERGMKCLKVTADTLARVMAGGNENSPEDMGALVRNADAVRHEIACAFEFIHHSGKNAALGARGHSSLRAATDTEVEVTNNDGLHVAEVTKQRDFDRGDEFAFRLRVVEMGRDKWGHPITSCVPEWVMDMTQVQKMAKLTNQETALLKFLKKSLSARKELAPNAIYKAAPKPPKAGQFAANAAALGEGLIRAGGLSSSDNADTQSRTFRRSLQSLRNKGVVEIFDGYVWLADMPDIGGQK